jgi:multimeric flavodoxin WrbA
MKVVAINGSPRAEGNTALMIKTVFAELEAQGIATELVQIGGKPLRGCIACMKCWDNQDGKCVITGDPLNDIVAKIREADAVILGSPTYFADVTAEMKALIDRSGMVARANGNFLKRKLGAAVIAVRRGGSMHALQSLQNYFLINEMIVPGSSYWNIGYGRMPGEVADDEEGMQTMKTLGQNMAWLLGKIAG